MATIRRDDSRGTLVCAETPHRSDTGEKIDECDAAQRSPAATCNPGDGDTHRADDVSELKAAMRDLARVKFIARENEPGAIERAISDRLEVQVNVWYRPSCQATPSHNMQQPNYFLGDTGPQYQVLGAALKPCHDGNKGSAAGWMRNHVAGASVKSKLEPMGEAYFEQALRADDATSLIPSLCNTKREPVRFIPR